MVRIGLDISYNSTGLCIIKETADNPIFYQISSFKQKHSASVKFLTYERLGTSDDFTENELNHIYDSEKLARLIIETIRKHVPKSEAIEFRIETPLNMAFLKRSMKYHSGNDMVIVNKIVTLFLTKMENASFKCLTVTKIKKAFSGKGNGKKDLMIETFKTKFPNFDYTGKYDDVVDAYALASSEF